MGEAEAVKIQVVSDCHLEFHQDGGAAFIEALSAKAKEVDVLVVAGDLATEQQLIPALKMLTNNFKHVVYVLGNHEFYGRAKVNFVRAALQHLDDQRANFHWLNRSTVIIEGQRFVGCPLWFKFSEHNKLYEHMMNDFSQIQRFKHWVYQENQEDMDFLRETVKADDIVVTHYLPAEESVAPQYKGSLLNCFFLCDVSEIIHFGGPKLWLHGHTHSSFDYQLGPTRVVCNPFGYARHEENREFEWQKVLEV